MALLRNVNTGSIIATRVDRAATFLQRAVGLLARPRIRPDEGLLIDKCTAIHTVGMRAPIDVIFLDAEMRVVRLCPNVRTFRFAVWCRKARSVVELGRGALQHNDVLPGDVLELVS
ncbi:MAG: DUF192 domain-containing protein [Candidatus Baltobacteraceae bacterium]